MLCICFNVESPRLVFGGLAKANACASTASFGLAVPIPQQMYVSTMVQHCNDPTKATMGPHVLHLMNLDPNLAGVILDIKYVQKDAKPEAERVQCAPACVL